MDRGQDDTARDNGELVATTLHKGMSRTRTPEVQRTNVRSKPHDASERSGTIPLRKTIVRPTSLPYSYLMTISLLVFYFISSASAAFINFDNCLSPSIRNSNPALLQWVPLFFDAKFNESAASHNMNITIYGNVTGKNLDLPYPAPDDPGWNNASAYPWAKFVNLDESNNRYTTLFSKYQVLTFTAFDAPAESFCNNTVNATCPVAPRFFANASNPAELAAFTVGHDFYSSFSFATLQTTIIVQSGDANATDLACISASITPDLGPTLSNVLRYLPMVVLIVVAIATISAAIFSPWGTSDIFRWTSNYGRDEDLLRLVTPGFGDCLQYIQFIVLAGALTLNYPGYFQPVVSKVSWSTLLFNESFVSGGDGTDALVDGIYVTNATYGIERLSQLVGLEAVEDIWASMVIWSLVIVAIVVLACQTLFFLRWSVKVIAKTSEQDLQSKNWPFTGGMLVRIVCNFFLLPIVTFSMFQFVVAPRSKVVVVAMAAVLLLLMLLFAAWILRLIITTKKRSSLFDELPIVMLYGPLYNTYADEAAAFALVPALLTFIRGIAIGAVQPSGIAQLVILAICEIVFILTLHTFRPFQSPTSMNTYHSVFSVVRLVVIMLMVAFIPGLGITEAPKGWVGYAILLLHALVLLFGFFLNAIQTLIEVIARAFGAGGDEETGLAARGGLSKVFGMRQLSRRPHNTAFRQSMNSDAAILVDDADAKSAQLGSRSRSLSASSAILLNRHMTPDSSAMDPLTPGQERYSFTPDMGGQGPGRRPDLSVRTGEITDPYYRPPRLRRPTGDHTTPGAKSRGSMGSGDWSAIAPEGPAESSRKDSAGNTISSSPPHNAPHPAFVRHREDSDTSVNRRTNVDYAVREVDFYYGVRGPALSQQPTRKLKTGPADPVGPVSSATGWFKNMFGGKKKDSSKGFEVVRSSRAPPPRAFEEDNEVPREAYAEPYRDSPQPKEAPVLPGQKTRSTDGDIEDTMPGQTEHDDPSSPWSSGDEGHEEMSDRRANRISDFAPSLAPIDTVGGIELPSRFGSKASRVSRQPSDRTGPSVPRRSSRRKSNGELDGPSSPFPRLTTIESSPRGSSQMGSIGSRVPFTNTSEDHGTTANTSLLPGPSAEETREQERQSSSTARTQEEPHIPEQASGIRQVVQHRTSDRISVPASEATPTGSAAELVEATPRVSTTERDVHG